MRALGYISNACSLLHVLQTHVLRDVWASQTHALSYVQAGKTQNFKPKSVHGRASRGPPEDALSTAPGPRNDTQAQRSQHLWMPRRAINYNLNCDYKS